MDFNTIKQAETLPKYFSFDKYNIFVDTWLFKYLLIVDTCMHIHINLTIHQ